MISAPRGVIQHARPSLGTPALTLVLTACEFFSSPAGGCAPVGHESGALSTFPVDLVIEQPFENLGSLAGSAAPPDSALIRVTEDVSAPRSAPYVARVAYPNDRSSDMSRIAPWVTLPPVRRVAVMLWWKADREWEPALGDVGAIASVLGQGHEGFSLALYGPPGGPYDLAVLPQQPTTGDGGWLTPNAAPGPVSMGQWHQLRWEVDANSRTVRWWLDGQLIGDHCGVPFSEGAFVGVDLGPFGDGPGPGETPEHFFWYDHVSAWAWPWHVTRLSIEPVALDLVVGSEARLAAVAQDSTGDQHNDAPVLWSSSQPQVATVSADGLVTAQAAGSTIITASSGGKHATSLISVLPPVNECAVPQPDWLWCEDFESGTLSEWNDVSLAQNKTIITNPALARSGSRYLRITYPQGSIGGSLSRFFLPGHDQLYARYYVRFPTEWIGGTKLLLLRGSRITNVWSSFGKAGVCPDGTDFFLANVVTRDDPTLPIRFYTYYPGMAREPSSLVCWGRSGDSDDPGGAPNPRATYFPPLDVTREEWHLVELEVQVNDPGESNGEQRIWLDGVLRGEWKDMVFRTTADVRITALTLEASMSASGSPQTQALLVDNVLVARKRP